MLDTGLATFQGAKALPGFDSRPDATLPRGAIEPSFHQPVRVPELTGEWSGL